MATWMNCRSIVDNVPSAPAAGGEVTRIGEEEMVPRTPFGRPIAWAGRGHLVYVSQPGADASPFAVRLVDVRTGASHEVPLDSGMMAMGVIGSPDGQRIAVRTWRGLSIRAEGDVASDSTRSPWIEIAKERLGSQVVKLSPDGSIFTRRNRRETAVSELWRLRRSDGQPELFAVIPLACGHTTMDAEQRTVVCDVLEQTSDVWVADRSAGGR